MLYDKDSWSAINEYKAAFAVAYHSHQDYIQSQSKLPEDLGEDFGMQSLTAKHGFDCFKIYAEAGVGIAQATAVVLGLRYHLYLCLKRLGRPISQLSVDSQIEVHKLLIGTLESKGFVVFDSYKNDVLLLEKQHRRGQDLSAYLEFSLSLVSSYHCILEVAEKRAGHLSAIAHSSRYRWDQLHYLALPFPMLGAIESSTPHPTLGKWPLIPTDLPPAPYNVLDFWHLEGDRIENSHLQWITEILVGWSLSAGV